MLRIVKTSKRSDTFMQRHGRDFWLQWCSNEGRFRLVPCLGNPHRRTAARHKHKLSQQQPLTSGASRPVGSLSVSPSLPEARPGSLISLEPWLGSWPRLLVFGLGPRGFFSLHRPPAAALRNRT